MLLLKVYWEKCVMLEAKNENYLPKYDEVEKDHAVAQGISKNNNILFNMIKEDIDCLITQRLLSLMKGYPETFIARNEPAIVDYKE